ncbi:MAG: VOC family protein [Solirubrobacterales bacterium]|nr:VOC family protein [Solirubrobacterales bacterium]
MFFFHFNVVCSDFDTSYDFYTNAVGMRPLTSSRAGTTVGEPANRADSAGWRPGESRNDAENGRHVAELLGFEGSGEWRGAFLYFGLSRAGAYVDLLQWKDPLPKRQRSAREIGLARVCIRVENLEEQLERLEQHGVPTVSEVKEMTLGVTNVRVVCFRDPDDVLLEYIEFAEKPWGT